MDLDDPTKALIEATSGAIGSLLSTSILYPLDTCKTKYQAESSSVQQRRYRSIGDVFTEAVQQRRILSLYQGLGTKNFQAVIAGFVYFYSYSYVKQKYLSIAKVRSMGTVPNLAVAAIAGACTAIVTQPLDTISARLQTSTSEQASSPLAIVRERGFFHLFDGLGASLLLVTNPAIQYTVFEQLREHILKSSRPKPSFLDSPAALSALSAFFVGAISKTVATVITYPLIRCKVMVQREDTEEEKQQRREGNLHAGAPKSVIQAMHIIWNGEGPAGFYRGMQAQILKTVLGAALMLMIKEKVSQGSRILVLALRRALAIRALRLKLLSPKDKAVTQLAARLHELAARGQTLRVLSAAVVTKFD